MRVRITASSRFVAVALVTGMVIATLAAVPPTPAYAAGDDNLNALSDGIGSLSDALSGLDALDELGNQIPLTNLLPTGNNALDLVDSLAEALRDKLPAVPAFVDLADLNTFLDANVNTPPAGTSLGNGVTAFVDITASDSPYGLTVHVLKFEYTDSTPIDFQEGEVTLDGGALDTSFSIVIADAGNALELKLDTTLPSPELYIDAAEHAMTVEFAVTAELSTSAFAAELGILDVMVGGTNAIGDDVSVTATFSARILDPDGDNRISKDEWTNTAPLDLFDVGYTGSSATTALSLTSSLAGLGSISASININDGNLSDGLQVDPGDIDLDVLSDFTNMSAQDVLATIRQLAISMTSLQIRAGNVKLPFTNSSLAELVRVNDKILQFFQDIGLSTSDNPLDFTIPDDFLETAGLTTVEAILGEFAKTITGVGTSTAADLGIGYDPVGHVLTWDILLANETYVAPAAGAGEKKLGLDFADQLESIGVLGLEIGADASVSVAPTYSVDMTVGLDLRDDAILGPIVGGDPIITDRIFLDTDGVEFSASAPIAANLELTGTIGILELSLEDSNGAGDVTLIGPRDGDSDPMLEIDIDGGTDGRVSLKDLFAALQADVSLDDYEGPGIEPKDRGYRLFFDQTDDAQDIEVLALFNVAVPEVSLTADASVGGTSLGNASVTIEWADLFAGDAPVIGTTGDFNDDFLNFQIDPNDPLALFNQIVDVLDGTLGVVDTLLLDDSILNEPLPLVDVSARDIVGFLGDLRDEINALVSDPAGALTQLAQMLEAQVLDAIGIPSIPQVPSPFSYIKNGANVVVPPDDPTGVFDLAGFNTDWATFTTDLAAWQSAIEDLLGTSGTFPTLLDPNTFVDPDTGFRLVDFLAELEDSANEILTWVTDKSGFIELEYVSADGGTPAALIIHLAIGICSTDKTDTACTVKKDLPSPAFNFNLEDYLGSSDFGGLVAAEGSGEFAVSYKAVTNIGLGIELPTVTPGATATDLPTVTGSITPFLLDDSSIVLEANAGLETMFSARIGPFEVAVGDPGPATPESDADGECDAGNVDDDDLDGFINDGCPTQGAPDLVPEDQGTQCDNATDDEDNDAATTGDQLDGYINDGCDAQGNPVVAKVGAMFTLQNEPSPGTADRVYNFGTYASGLTPTLEASDDADCGDGPKAACANLPLYLNLGGSDEFLGEINFSIDTFDDLTPTLTGIDAIAAELADKADAIAWELIKQGLLTLQAFLDDATEASNYGESIPVIGDALDAGVEVAGVFNDRILTPVNDTLIPLLESFNEATEVTEAMQTFFWEQLYEDSPSDTILLTRDATTGTSGIGEAPSGAPTTEDFVNVVATCKTGAVEDECVDGDSTLSIVDLQVQFAIGQVAAATTPPFDFGFPGLRLASEDPLEASVGWRLDVGFGLSFKDGFYLVTGDGGYIGDLAGAGFGGRDAEATISSSINMPDTMEGDLAFIQIDITDKDPEDADDGAAQTLKEADGTRDDAEATLAFEIDIAGGGSDERVGLTELVGGANALGFTPKLTGGIDVLVGLRTTVNLPDVDDGSIPSLLAVLDLKWEFAASGEIKGGLDIGALEASMDDIRIDLGSFISDFLAPVLGEVQRYTKPLQPVIDVVSAPIPGLTELAALVGEPPITLIGLFEAISDNDLTMIKRIIDLISFVNSIPTNPGEIIIDLGAFDIDTAGLREPALPATEKGKLVKNANVVTANVMNALETSGNSNVTPGFKTQLGKSRTGGGFSFPAFEDPTQLFGLLMGDNPTLIRWDAGLLEASMSFSQTFGPIAVGPIPVSLVISGAAGIQGRFAIGYDTKGIRQMVEVLTDDDDSNNGFFSTFGLLFAGVFIDDNDAEGNDVAEITLFGELAAGAAVDLVIISAGVEGGVRLTIDLNLHDGGFDQPPDPENLDGKLRIDEIITFIHNPLCLFDVSGKIEAFIRVFVKIDLFLFSKTFRKTIVNITLLDLQDITADLCAPPEPVLGQNDGGTLVLTVGARASDRNFAEDEPDEKFTVRQLGPGKVSVTAFGYYEEHPKSGQPAITKIFADAGDGNDVIVMEAGAVPRVDGDGIVVLDGAGNPINDIIDFTIPTEICGGPGNDRIAGGEGIDRLVGDGAETGADTYVCSTADAATDGADEIGGLGGNDQLYGTGSDDVISGDAGNDTIRGGTGNDQISGGFGMDEMYGGSGNDATDQAFLDLDSDRSDDDEILGGPEPKPNGSTSADDKAWGGLGDDSIEGDVGDDELHGGPGIDVITGDAGEDKIFGDAGTDVLFGNEDNDIIEGGADDDDVFGNDGDDILWGDDAAGSESGNDDIIGGIGDDEMHGGAGFDVMLGDEGNINRDPGAAPPFTPNDPDLPLVQLTTSTALVVADTMFGGGGADVMWGQEGEDDMFGGGGDDEMHGNAAGDEMHGNAGGDSMFGDGGIDTMYGDDDDPATNVDGADTMRGGSEGDFMFGNADGDVMFGDSGDDVMYGDDDDPTTGGDLNDTMRGGIGLDLMFGNDDGDLMFGEADDDRMVGGSSTADEADGADTMSGGRGSDVMAGDNATIGTGLTAVDRLVSLREDGEGAGDIMAGDSEGDRMFGQTGSDDMSGNDGNDYLEGNAGSDDIRGNDGDDDLTGGSSAADGVIDADRDGTGRADSGDEMWGGDGVDWMAGDNALLDRNFDLGAAAPLVLFDVNSGAAAVSGGDYMYGGSNNDVMFGQGNGDQPAGEADPPDGFDNDLDGATDEDGPIDMSVGARWEGDALFGESGTDYIEGNHGSDYIVGGAENDDLIGGGSANDGGTSAVVDGDRNGTGLDDERDTIHGDGGVDWITGDNARLDRNFDLGATNPIVLFDVNSTDQSTSAGDYVRGGDSDDVMFGQGNGDQPAGQADPRDGGVDNDLDNGNEGPDEDQPWQGDVMFGDAGDDYLEGNHGSDLMFGDAGDGSVSGDDDLVGGGSANDGDATAQTGTFVATRSGAGLDDDGDTIYGEGGVDWMAGDNAFVERNEDLGGVNDFVLFDVNSTNSDLSGGDYMNGGPADDFMVGQGNGAQGAQADPLDGVDNDGDGATDEDQPWLGDVMLGGTGDDYMEGNAGSDVMFGDDADGNSANDGQDDMIGGGSANEGNGTSVLVLDGAIIDATRTGDGLNDGRDIMRGEGAEDFMAGDNARIDRGGTLTGLTLATDRSVQLFDTELAGGAISTAYSGGDWMSGGDEPDVMFGQGNGAQPADQADPLDGVDNDFDGREDGDPNDADDAGYDCADNGFDNDEDGDADGADSDCTTAVDEDQPWQGDIMFGDDDEDYMEGNHGADWMFGNAGEDDMIGGGSANDGAIVPDRDPQGLTDGPDVMAGNGEDDVMTGDNASINRVVNGAGTDWVRISTPANPEPGYAAYDQAVRVTDMHDGDAGADTHGNDYMTGNGGNDEMYGQLSDDFVLGNEGDDALVGDLGQVTANIIGDATDDPAPEDISTNSPHWDDRIYERGSMWWETVLYAYDTSNGGVGGDDVMLGYDGRDTAFGGPGDDVINGDGDGTDEFLDVENPEYSHITDVDPATSDRDLLFGGDDGDAIWGGRDNDILMGGHGDDFLDVRPREETDNGRTGAHFRIIPRDPASWFTYAFPESLQDVDFIYGGWDRDALQADQAENGPDPGDRLADWAGAYNVFYLCPAGYGDHTITRMGSPHSQAFLQQLAEASGAIGAATGGTSGFRDLGYVFPNERGQNSNPPHPDHPGHFTCINFEGVGSGVAQAEAGGPYAVPEGGTAGLDGSGSSGGGGVASYNWTVDPLSIDDASSATPTVDAAGLDDSTITVELEITDGDGAVAMATADVEVVNVAPTVTVDSLTTSVASGDEASVAVSFDDPGELDTHVGEIDWGDGSTCDPDVDVECTLIANGDGTGTVTGTHTYAADGNYDVTVTVTDDDSGTTVEAVGTVAVGVPPVAPGVISASQWETTDLWPLASLTIGGIEYDRAETLDVMDNGSNTERSSTLFRELAAALLNQAASNDTSCIDLTVASADAWLVAHPPGSGVRNGNNAWKNEAMAYWEALLDYNNGNLCAPPA